MQVYLNQVKENDDDRDTPKEWKSFGNLSGEWETLVANYLRKCKLK